MKPASAEQGKKGPTVARLALFYSAAYFLSGGHIVPERARRRRRALRLRGPPRGGRQELAVERDALRQFPRRVDGGEPLGASGEFFARVRDDVLRDDARGVRHVEVGDAACQPERGALVPHGVREATDRSDVRLRGAVQRGAELGGPERGRDDGL